MKEDYLIGIDLGAGSGAKLGIFNHDLDLISRNDISVKNIHTKEELAEKLCDKIKELMPKSNRISQIGLASPGIFTSEGKYIVAANLEFLKDQNLRKSLEKRLDVSVSIENDANAGGLAEWNESREELFYWALGGGWGGAWISELGEIKHSTLDWDGKDESLHLTSEPGYATFLTRNEISEVFHYYGADFDKLDVDLSEKTRAEKLISGPGMSRIYKAVSGEYIEPQKIDDLAEKGDYKARTCYAIFGSLLAAAGEKIIKKYNKSSIPIHMGGKPSNAFPYFGWIANMRLNERYSCCLKQSEIFKNKGNSNLIGAAILAKREDERRKRRY